MAASAVSQSGTVDSDGATAERAGWDMQDVLLRLGAVPGEYLTHIIMVRQADGSVESKDAFCQAKGNKATLLAIRGCHFTGSDASCVCSHKHTHRSCVRRGRCSRP